MLQPTSKKPAVIGQEPIDENSQPLRISDIMRATPPAMSSRDREISGYDKMSRGVETGVDISKYERQLGKDFDVLAHRDMGINIDDLRAKKQTYADLWGNSLGKMGVTAGVTFLDGTLGTVYGLANLAAGGSFWNNEFSSFLNEIRDKSEEWMPVYYTASQQDSPWYQNLGDANFWADKVVKNMGFTMGAVASGAAWGGAFSAVTKSVMNNAMKGIASKMFSGNMDDVAKAIKSGELNLSSVASEVAKDARTLKNLNLSQQMIGSLAGAFGEARIESLGLVNEMAEDLIMKYDHDFSINERNYRDEIRGEILRLNPGMAGDMSGMVDDLVEQGLKERYDGGLEKVKKLTIAAGNVNFGIQTALLTLSNYGQFSRAFGKDFGLQKKALGNIAKAGESITDGVKFEKSAGRILSENMRYLSNPFQEFNEEMMQGVTSDAAKTFYSRKFDPEAQGEVDSFIKTFVNSFADSYGNIDNWEEGIIGMFSGIAGSPSFVKDGKVGLSWAGGVMDDVSEVRAENRAAKEITEKIDAIVKSPEFKNRYSDAVTSMSYEMDMKKSILDNDAFGYNNAEASKLITDFLIFERAGMTSDFLDHIDGMKNYTIDEAKAAFTPTRDINGKPIPEELRKSIFEEMGKTDQEIKQYLVERADRLKKFTLDLIELKSDIDLKYNNVSEEVRAEVIFAAATINDVNRRIGQLKLELPSSISTLIDATDFTKITKEQYNELSKSVGLILGEISKTNPVEASKISEKALDYSRLHHKLYESIILLENYQTAGGISNLIKIQNEIKEKSLEQQSMTEERAMNKMDLSEVPEKFRDVYAESVYIGKTVDGKTGKIVDAKFQGSANVTFAVMNEAGKIIDDFDQPVIVVDYSPEKEGLIVKTKDGDIIILHEDGAATSSNPKFSQYVDMEMIKSGRDVYYDKIQKMGGDVTAAKKRELDNLAIEERLLDEEKREFEHGAIEPFDGTVNSLMRTTVSQELFKQNPIRFEPQLMFQTIIDSYDTRTTEDNKGYSRLLAVTKDKLIELIGSSLNEQQKQELDSPFAKNSIFTLIVDKSGKPRMYKSATSESQIPAYAVISEPIKDADTGLYKNERFGGKPLVSTSKITHARVLSGEEFSIAQQNVDNLFQEAMEEFSNFRNSVAESNSGVLLNITGRTTGIKTKIDGHNPAVGSIVKSSKDINNIDVVVAKDYKLEHNDVEYNAIKGFAYVVHNGNLVNTKRGKVSTSDAETILNIIKYAMASKQDDALEVAKKLISQYTYFVYETKGREMDKNQFRFYFGTSGRGESTKVDRIVIGDVTINKGDIVSGNPGAEQLILEFLSNKFYNVDSGMLGDNKVRIPQNFKISKNKKGEISAVTFDTVVSSYKEFLFASKKDESPRVLISIAPMPGNKLEEYDKPQFVNRSFKFSPINTIPNKIDETKKAEVVRENNKKTKQPEKSVKNGIVTNEISRLKDRLATITKDESRIDDTLGYLETLLDETIGIVSPEVNTMISRINELKSLVNSNSKKKTKRGVAVAQQMDSIRIDIKDEHSILNDIQNRIRSLEEELQIIGELKKDLKNQIDYYEKIVNTGLIGDVSKKNIEEKIQSIRKKRSVLLRIFERLRRAIRFGKSFLGFYINETEKSINKLDSFKKSTNFKKLDTSELRALINKDDKSDEDYFRLSKLHNELSKNIDDNIKAVDDIEDLNNKNQERLDAIDNKIKSYDSQIRYLEELSIAINEFKSISTKKTPEISKTARDEVKKSSQESGIKPQKTLSNSTEVKKTATAKTKRVEKGIASSISDIEAKKADIERRRKDNLEDTGDPFDYVSKEPRTDGRFNAFYTTTKESAIFDTYQEAIDWVSTKYELELKALEETLATTASPKISEIERINKEWQDELNLRKRSAKLSGGVPTKTFNNIIDKINAKYEAKLAALEESPTVPNDKKIIGGGFMVPQSEADLKRIRDAQKEGEAKFSEKISEPTSDMSKFEEPKFEEEEKRGKTEAVKTKKKPEAEVKKVVNKKYERKKEDDSFINDEDAPFFTTTSSSIPFEKIEYDSELSEFLKIFPDFQVLPLALKNSPALLSSMSGAVKVLIDPQRAPKGTFWHEGFHIWFNFFSTINEKKDLISELKNRLNEQTVTVGDKELKAGDMSDKQAEEYLAEEFRTYMIVGASNYKFDKTEVKKKNLFGRFLEAIRRMFNYFTRRNDSIETIFDTISKGEFKINEVTNRPEGSWSLIGSNNMSESIAMTKALNYYFFDTIYSVSLSKSNAALEDTDSFVSKIYTSTYNKIIDELERQQQENNGEVNYYLDEIIENWDEAVAEHTKLLKQYKINISVESIDEISSDMKTQGMNKQFFESNLFNVKDGLPSKLRMLIASLPKVNRNNEVSINKYGLPESADFAQTLAILHKNLANISTFRDMIIEITKLSKQFPHLNTLIKRLGVNENYEIIESADKNTFQMAKDFFIQFYKARNTFYSGLINTDGNFYSIESFSDTNENRLRMSWRNNAKSLAEDADSIFDYNKDGALVLNKNAKIKIGNRVYPINKVSEVMKMNEHFKHNTSSAYAELLSYFGINVSERVGYSELFNAVKYLISNIESSKNDITVDDLFNPEVIKINKELKNLAREQAKYDDTIADNQYINSKGQTENSISLKSRLHKVTEDLQKINTSADIENLPEYIKPFGLYEIRDENDEVIGEEWSGSFATFNSEWIEWLGQRNNTMEIGMLRAFGQENADKEDINDLKPGDLTMFEFNSVLDGALPYLRAEGRKLEYVFNFGKTYAGRFGLDTNASAVAQTLEKYVQREILYALAARKNGSMNSHFVNGGLDYGLQLFKQILPEIDKIIYSGEYDGLSNEELVLGMEEIFENNEEYIKYQLLGFAKMEEKRTLDWLLDNKVVIDAGVGHYRAIGISPDHLIEIGARDVDQIDKKVEKSSVVALVNKFNAIYLSSAIEQVGLVTGSVGTYMSRFDHEKNTGISSLHKRTTGYASTVSGAINEQSFIDLMNTHYPRIDAQITENKNHQHSQNRKDFVYNDLKVNSELISLLENIGVDGVKKAYSGMTENDAQGWGLLDGYRSFAIRTGKEWGEAQEKSFMYQMQYGLKEAVRLKMITQDKFNSIFSIHFPSEGYDPNYQYYKREKLYVENMAVFTVDKPQGTGVIQNEDLVQFSKVDFTKTSVAPLLFTDIIGTPLFEFAIDAMMNNVDFIFPKTAKKAEVLGNNKGELANIYNPDGSLKKISTAVSEGFLITEILWSDIGNQLDIDPDGKTEVSDPTQKRRLNFVDAFENGTGNTEDVELYEEYTSIINNIIERKLDDVLKSLGLELEEGSSEDYNIVDNKKLTDYLISQIEARESADNVVDSVKIVLGSNNKFFDTIPTKRQLVNLLQGLVRNKAISIKTTGDMLIQVASTGFESIGSRNGKTKVSNFLKFYRPIKTDGTEYTQEELNSLKPEDIVKIAPAEVMISLPKEWIPYVNKHFTGTFEQKLEQFNKAILDPKTQAYQQFIKLRTFVATRIPGQHLNSIEVMTVVKFLHPMGGSRAILPTEIVAKSGSDFDIDKLTALFNSYKIDKETLAPIYEDHKESGSIKALQNRLNEISMIQTLRPSNYQSLMTPNGAGPIAIAADKYNPASEVVRMNNLIIFPYNMRMAENQWSANALVGIGANNVTSHATTQAHPVVFDNDVFRLFFDSFSDDFSLGMGWIENDGGDRISDANSGILSGAVDAGKETNPAIFRANITTATANAVFTLMRTGSEQNKPLSIEKIVAFMTHDIVKKYEIEAKRNESIFLKANELNIEKRDIISNLIGLNKAGYLYEHMSNYIKKSMNPKATEEEISYYKGLLMNAINSASEKYGNINFVYDKKEYKYIIKADNESLTDKAVLEYYLYYLELGKILNMFQSVTRPDAGLDKDRVTLKVNHHKLENLKRSGIIKEGLENIIENSFLNGFHRVHNAARNMFKKFNISEMEDRVNEFIWGENGEAQIFMNPELSRPSDKISSAIMKIENTVLNAILHTTPVNKQKVNQKYQELIVGKNSIPRRLADFKKIKGVRENPFVKEMVSVIEEYNTKRDEKLKIDYIKSFNRKYTTEESNQITEGFRELLDSEDSNVAKFAIDLITFSVIQTGVQVGPNSFFELIPAEHYYSVVSDIISSFIESDINIFTEQFRDEIYANLSNDKNIVPQQKVYTKFIQGAGYIPTNLTMKSGKIVQLTVSERSQNSNYDYLTVLDQSHKIHPITKKKIYNTVLMKKTNEFIVKGDNRYHVYVPINKKGVPTKFFEFGLGYKSGIPTNNYTNEKPATNSPVLRGSIVDKAQPQLSQQSELKPGKELNDAVDTFLSKIGITVNKVSEIKNRAGEVIGDENQGVIAIAKIIDKTIDIIEKRADVTTLPEEAAHFYVDLLGESNILFKSMMNKIESLPIYQRVLGEYYDYYNGDVNKIKKEAIGKAIAMEMTGNTDLLQPSEKPQIKNWFKTLWIAIKNMFNTSSNPYAKAASNIINSNLKGLNTENKTSESQVVSEVIEENNSINEINELKNIAEQEYLQTQNNIISDSSEFKDSNTMEIDSMKKDDKQITKQEILANFDTMFPVYSEFSQAEREIFVEEMLSGNIETYCNTKAGGASGGLKAKNGMTNTISGKNWKIVKDFKGQPKHSQGGVDITISNKGVVMRRGGKDIKAAHGLLIENIN